MVMAADCGVMTGAWLISPSIWAFVKQNFQFLWIPGPSINIKRFLFNCMSTRYGKPSVEVCADADGHLLLQWLPGDRAKLCESLWP